MQKLKAKTSLHKIAKTGEMISSLKQGSGTGEEDRGVWGVWCVCVCVCVCVCISFKFNNIVSKENFLDAGLTG